MQAAFRRQGIGASLMRTMLLDDRKLGFEYSALTATELGSALYPALGYQLVGTLYVFHPTAKFGH